MTGIYLAIFTTDSKPSACKTHPKLALLTRLSFSVVTNWLLAMSQASHCIVLLARLWENLMWDTGAGKMYQNSLYSVKITKSKAWKMRISKDYHEEHSQNGIRTECVLFLHNIFAHKCSFQFEVKQGKNDSVFHLSVSNAYVYWIGKYECIIFKIRSPSTYHQS